MLLGFPIFDRIPDFASPPVSSHESVSSGMDSGVRSWKRWDGNPLLTFSHTHTSDEIDTADEVFSFYLQRNGAAEAFWVPTWQPDFALYSGVPDTANTIEIYAVNYDSVYLQGKDTDLGRYLHIYNELTGTTWIAKVTGVTVTGEKEVLTVDSNAPEEFLAESTVVSHLVLSRFEDEMEFIWYSPHHMSASTPFVQSRDIDPSEPGSSYTYPENIPDVTRKLAVDDDIDDMVRFGDLFYVVGEFNNVQVMELQGGSWVATTTLARGGAACFNSAEGNWTSWAPNISGDGRSISISDDGTKAYIASSLTPFLRAFDTSTGIEDPVFIPGCSEEVGKIEHSNGRTVVIKGRMPTNEFPTPWRVSINGFDEFGDPLPAVNRSFHILDETGKPIPITDAPYGFGTLATKEPFPSSVDAWVLGVSGNYLFFSNKDPWMVSKTANLPTNLALYGIGVTSDFEIEYDHAQPGGVYRINLQSGYVEGSSKVPEGTYYGHVYELISQSEKWGVSPSDEEFNSPLSPIFAWGDSERNRLIVWGVGGGSDTRSWVQVLDTGEIPPAYQKSYSDRLPSTGTIPRYGNAYPIGENLLISGSFATGVTGYIARRNDGGRISEYGYNFDRTKGSTLIPSADGKSIWIGGRGGIMKTLPTDGREINVEDNS